MPGGPLMEILWITQEMKGMVKWSEMELLARAGLIRL